MVGAITSTIIEDGSGTVATIPKLASLIDFLEQIDTSLYMVKNGISNEVKILPFTSAIEQFYEWRDDKPTVEKATQAGEVLYGQQTP